MLRRSACASSRSWPCRSGRPTAPTSSVSPVKTSQGVTGKNPPPVADDVALVVVFGRLYEENTERRLFLNSHSILRAT